MTVQNFITNTQKTVFSFEILPPLKGNGIDRIYKIVDKLREFDPKYINITTHRSEYIYKEADGGLFQRVAVRTRPGTVALAAAIQHKYNITAVPHIICSGFSKAEIEYSLIDLNFLGIDMCHHRTPEGVCYLPRNHWQFCLHFQQEHK